MPLNPNNSKGEAVIDPYKHKERFLRWDKIVHGISKSNSDIIVKYLMDMRLGINISPGVVKGKRSYHRLNTQKYRLKKVAELLEKHFGINTLVADEMDAQKKLEQALIELFMSMEEGSITKNNGKRFLSINDYLKGYKALWHWYMIYMKNEKDKIIPDITQYINIKGDHKPKFVFFGEVGSLEVEKGFKKLVDASKPKYKVIFAFLFDSGIRTPTEFMNVKRKDITPIKDTRYFWLNIREETAKTYGRKIKLMLCHDILREYLTENDFQPDDFVFKICPRKVNQYISRLGEKILNKKGITMYDFRHNSACYWLPRYQKENALLYRFGWKDSKMLHYYTELLGMKDTIQHDDLLVDITKTELEKQLQAEVQARELMNEQITDRFKQLDKINIIFDELIKTEPNIIQKIQDIAERKIKEGVL